MTGIKLQFPESIDGTIEGISDAGIETFAGNVLDALAREQSQNSIDARAKSAQDAVQVKYELIHIAAAHLPGKQDLKNSITSAQRYWGTSCSKTQRALERAAKMIARDTIPCLRISDRNTSGLTGSRLTRGNWFNLTKASGVSEKGSGKGGSFGIGKNAFFANSVLRTVFFSTHDVENKWAFQGVTKLVSHEVKGKMLRATGFLGEKGFLPITNKADIPKLFQCNGTGTDIIIVGFDAKEGWRDQLTAAFVENFFVAIHSESLEVLIQQEDNPKAFDQLSSVTLSNIVHALATKDERRFRPLLDFHDAMVSPDAHAAETFIDGLGKLTLRLLLREGARKKVAMFRKTGMKIFEKDRFRTPIEFAGVFQCLGDEGNELLRRLEPPSHDKWEPERYEDEARKALALTRQVYEWIRKCVNDLQIPDAGDKQAIPGLERLLPDDFEEPFDNADKAPVEGNPKPAPNNGVKGIMRPPKTKPGDESGAPAGGTSTGDTGGGGDTAGGDGTGGGGGGATGGGPNPTMQDVNIENRTFLDAGTSRYRMMAKFRTAGTYDVLLFAIGDDGRAEAVAVVAPKVLIGGKTVKANVTGQNKITKILIAGPSSVEIQFASPSMIPRTMLAKVQRHV